MKKPRHNLKEKWRKSTVRFILNLGLLGASAVYLLSRDIVKESVFDIFTKTGRVR